MHPTSLVVEPKAVVIPLTRGMSTIIDAADAAIVQGLDWHTARRGRTFYAAAWTANHDGKVYMHRLISGARPGQRVDHVDGDGLNNRRSNLRFATALQNSANQRAHGGRSRFRGVHPQNRKRGRWAAQITVNYKCRHLGVFATEEDAARAYDAAAAESYGAFARLNFPAPPVCNANSEGKGAGANQRRLGDG